MHIQVNHTGDHLDVSKEYIEGGVMYLGALNGHL